MGIRFRKSIKIAPGVRLNLNKKSVGMSFGKKGLHYSINSSGRKTTSVSIPGTGISYVKTTNTKSGKSNRNSSSAVTAKSNPYKPDTSNIEIKNTDRSSMIFGILSVITSCCCFGGLLGIIGRGMAKNSINNFGSNKYNKIGLITSYIGIAIAIIMFGYGLTSTIKNPTTPTNNDIAKQITTEKFTTEEPETEEVTTQEPETEEVTTEKPAAKKKQSKKNNSKNASSKKNTTTEAQIKETQEAEVWVSSTGSKYHSNSSCSGMKNPSKVSISSAKNMGLTPCKRCYR